MLCGTHLSPFHASSHYFRQRETGKNQTSRPQVPVQERVFRSTRVWNLYLDLEESLGTVQTAKAAYERALEVCAGVCVFLASIDRANRLLTNENTSVFVAG